MRLFPDTIDYVLGESSLLRFLNGLCEGGEREVEGVRGGGVEGVAGRVQDREIRAHSTDISTTPRNQKLK